MPALRLNGDDAAHSDGLDRLHRLRGVRRHAGARGPTATCLLTGLEGRLGENEPVVPGPGLAVLVRDAGLLHVVGELAPDALARVDRATLDLLALGLAALLVLVGVLGGE